jgi:hypothetical protein
MIFSGYGVLHDVPEEILALLRVSEEATRKQLVQRVLDSNGIWRRAVLLARQAQMRVYVGVHTATWVVREV